MTIVGEGVVDITGAPGPDDRQALLDFLDAVDVQAVEQAALDRQGWGDSKPFTGHVVDVLRETLTGAPQPA